MRADVAVGAPQEDDLNGAVYIYNGRREGISSTPSQVQTDTEDLRMIISSINSGEEIHADLACDIQLVCVCVCRGLLDPLWVVTSKCLASH